MTEDSADFVAKLRQIEELANAINGEAPQSPMHARLQHMAILAKALRGRLELGVVAIVRERGAPPAGQLDKPSA
ncbi:MAG TPA: hypothetical protein VFB93_26400 [Burkholderiales bacterium]|nr:hypothetical protein [Burkholderiales bacterium]